MNNPIPLDDEKAILSGHLDVLLDWPDPETQLINFGEDYILDNKGRKWKITMKAELQDA